MLESYVFETAVSDDLGSKQTISAWSPIFLEERQELRSIGVLPRFFFNFAKDSVSVENTKLVHSRSKIFFFLQKTTDVGGACNIRCGKVRANACAHTTLSQHVEFLDEHISLELQSARSAENVIGSTRVRVSTGTQALSGLHHTVNVE